MANSRQQHYRTLAWLILVVGLAVRVWLSSRFLLVPDEANYWQWSRYLALGYQDHPPLIAWTIRLATTLFGQNELAVRLPANLGLALAAGYMILLAARIFSWRTAVHLSLSFQGVLLFNGAALIATPDSMLLPCWAGASYHAWLALRQNQPGQWLLTGAWFGLGLLGKYTMLLFPGSLLLCILLIKPYRRRLAQPAPWLGLLLGFVLFTPVLLWNAGHEWATFRHVLYMGGVNAGGFFKLRYIDDFLGAQVALLSPLVLILILAAWLGRLPGRALDKADLDFLRWTSLPVATLFLLLSLHSRVYGNWPAPGYLTALVLIAGLCAPRLDDDKTGRLWTGTLVLAYLISLTVLAQAVRPVLPLPVHLDRTARETAGWDTLGKMVAEAVAAIPNPDNPFVFAMNYQYASELAFYVPGQPRTVSLNRFTRPNVYDYWFEDAMLKGRDGIGVIDDPALLPYIRFMFKRAIIIGTVEIHRDYPLLGRQLVTTHYLVRARGFREGQRWHPLQPDDIRATRTQTGQD